MAIAFLLLIAILTVPATVAYFVSYALRIRLQNEGVNRAKTISVIVYIACFVVSVVVILFASSFIHLER